MSRESSAVYFPLHTSVELFADPALPNAVTRAKEAAVLYDRVIFEEGLLDVTITSGGSSAFWTPPGALTPERLARSRVPVPVGAPFTLAMGKQEAPGVPAEPDAMRVLMSDAISVAYAAEFHSGILDDLKPRPDWVEAIATGGGDLPRSTPIGELVGRMNFADWTDKALLPGRPTFERDFVYKSFNRDSTVAAALGSAFNLTPLFEPMVRRRGVGVDSPGSESLGVIVPNVGALPWEAVVEFREHPGSQEARAKLREFDERAAQGDAEAANAYLLAVAQEVTAMLFQVIDDQRKGLPEQMAEEAIKTAVSFVPVVGPVVEVAASMADAVVDQRRFRRSWIAALMQLRARA